MESLVAACAILLVVGKCRAAEPATPANLLKQVAERYKTLTVYEIEADSDLFMTKAGRSGSFQDKTFLAVGQAGQFGVEQTSNGVQELRLSDGKITWEALPKQKIWSSPEVAQAAAEDDAGDEVSDSPMGRYLFTQTKRSFVARYAGLARYADSATDAGTAQIKFNGVKTECYVFQIPVRGGKNRLFVAKTPANSPASGATTDNGRNGPARDDRL